MFKLRESVEDFNGKYKNSIALATWTDKKDEHVQKWIYVYGINNNYLSCLTPNAEAFRWEEALISFKNLKELEFHLPSPGYYMLDGYFPFYLDRAAVRNTSRGWNRASIKVEHTTPFSRVVNPAYKHPSQNANDIDIVLAVQQKKVYTTLEELVTKDIAILSADFLAIKCKKTPPTWAIMYQNNYIGTYVAGKESRVELQIPEIYDVFRAEVR